MINHYSLMKYIIYESPNVIYIWCDLPIKLTILYVPS